MTTEPGPILGVIQGKYNAVPNLSQSMARPIEIFWRTAPRLTKAVRCWKFPNEAYNKMLR